MDVFGPGRNGNPTRQRLDERKTVLTRRVVKTAVASSGRLQRAVERDGTI